MNSHDEELVRSFLFLMTLCAKSLNVNDYKDVSMDTRAFQQIQVLQKDFMSRRADFHRANPVEYAIASVQFAQAILRDGKIELDLNDRPTDRFAQLEDLESESEEREPSPEPVPPEEPKKATNRPMVKKGAGRGRGRPPAESKEPKEPRKPAGRASRKKKAKEPETNPEDEGPVDLDSSPGEE